MQQLVGWSTEFAREMNIDLHMDLMDGKIQSVSSRERRKERSASMQGDRNWKRLLDSFIARITLLLCPTSRCHCAAISIFFVIGMPTIYSITNNFCFQRTEFQRISNMSARSMFSLVLAAFHMSVEPSWYDSWGGILYGGSWTTLK